MCETKAPFTKAVLHGNVPEHLLHGVMCDWEQGSIFKFIYTGNLTAQDPGTFPYHSLYGCVENGSSQDFCHLTLGSFKYSQSQDFTEQILYIVSVYLDGLILIG